MKGTLRSGVALSGLTWLRVGGAAAFLFQPASADDLAQFLKNHDPARPIFALGVGSNLIVRDGGIEGSVVRLGRGFNQIEKIDETKIFAGAAALDAHVARKAGAWGIDLSFLRTIPGTIGGAVAMNAGCYGRSMANIVRKVVIVNRQGGIEEKPPKALDFGYRSARLEGAIVVGAVLEGTPETPQALEAKMEAQIQRRNATQPRDVPSAGSVFRNPCGFSSGGQRDDIGELKAWALIDQSGMRGFRLGGAQISEKHANFMINCGGATAADFEALGSEVIKRVLQKKGIRLEWEIVRVGRPLPA